MPIDGKKEQTNEERVPELMINSGRPDPTEKVYTYNPELDEASNSGRFKIDSSYNLELGFVGFRSKPDPDPPDLHCPPLPVGLWRDSTTISGSTENVGFWTDSSIPKFIDHQERSTRL